jgi:hypothetical protein
MAHRLSLDRIAEAVRIVDPVFRQQGLDPVNEVIEADRLAQQRKNPVTARRTAETVLTAASREA